MPEVSELKSLSAHNMYQYSGARKIYMKFNHLKIFALSTFCHVWYYYLISKATMARSFKNQFETSLQMTQFSLLCKY